MTSPVGIPVPLAVVDGVNVDAVAAAVRACPAVENLDGGRFGEVVTYLPGRRVPGVRVASDAVLVQIRGRWGVPAVEVATQIRRALAGLTAGRPVDVILADVGDPPVGLIGMRDGTDTPAGTARPGAVVGEAVVGEDAWTSSGHASAGSSSGRTTPTAAATHRRSSLAWPASIGCDVWTAVAMGRVWSWWRAPCWWSGSGGR
jgi:hypothetical protein